MSNLPPGDYDITVTAANFQNGADRAIVQASASSTASVSLAPTTGDLAVTVRDATTNAPVALAAVALSGAGSASGTTDGQGVARFTALAPGGYQISASAGGFQSGNVSASVVVSNQGVLVDPPAGVNAMSVTGPDMRVIGPTYQANANTMRLVYCGGLASGSRGETIELIDHPTPPTAAGASYINASVSATAPYSPAHELGHQLTDKPFPNDHYRQPAGSPRLRQDNNLMRGGGTSSAESFSASKRLWDVAGADGLNQFTATRGSTFTRS